MQVPSIRGNVVRFGLYEADLEQRLLTKNGNRVRLQDQPFQILKLLLERPGELVTREEIRQKLWSVDTYVAFDDGLNTAIKKLRTALNDTADNPRFIETIPRRGYRFIAPISSPSPTEPGQQEPAKSDLLIATRKQSRIVIEQSSEPSRSLLIAGIAVLLMLGAAGTAYVYRARHRLRPTQGSAPASLGMNIKMRPSVAVLGFRNLSGRPDQAWLSTALTQMLNTELAEGEQLRMVSGEQIDRARRDTPWEPSDTLAQNSLAHLRLVLNTDYVTLGSYTVVGAGEKTVIRMDVRLQDAIAGETLTETSVTGNESDLFELVSKAGAQLRQRLGIIPPGREHEALVKSSLPTNLAAARLYAEGTAKMRVFDAPAARDLLEKAITADPQHALSHAALAETWSALGYDAKAQDEAKKAFDLSTSLTHEDRLSVEGRYRVLTHDYPRAIEIYKALNNFFPDNLEYSLSLAYSQTKGGSPKDALQTVAVMRSLPPLENHDPRIDLMEAFAAETLSDFRRSEQAAEAADAKAAAQGNLQLKADAKAREAWAWNRLGDPDKAIAAYTAAFELSRAAGNPRDAASAMHGMGQAFYTKGELIAARESFETALADFRKIGAMWDVASTSHNLSMVLIDQGRLQLAKAHLEEALRIQRELNDERGVAADLDDLSNVLLDLGQLDASVKMKQQALENFQHLGNRMSEAITLTNFGILLFDKGNPQEAKQKLDQALAIKQQIGFKSGIAYTLFSIADILFAQDHIEDARNSAERALAIRTELKNENQIADSKVQLAKISLEQGHAAEAERFAAAASTTFTKEQDASDGMIAQAVLARTLMTEGKMQEASTAADRALALTSQSEDLTMRFIARLTAAQVQFANGNPSEALKALQTIRADAHRYGYVPYELEARLHIAEVKLRQSRTGASRADLAALTKDARDHGFTLIAREAAELAK